MTHPRPAGRLTNARADGHARADQAAQGDDGQGHGDLLGQHQGVCRGGVGGGGGGIQEATVVESTMAAAGGRRRQGLGRRRLAFMLR